MRFNRLIAPAVLALSLAACTTDDDPTGPTPAEERAAAATALTSLSAKISDAGAKEAVDIAAKALNLGAPITSITMSTGTASIARNAVINARVAADIGGGSEGWSATGLQLVIQNSAITAANGTFNVLVMWQGEDNLVFVGMPNSVSSGSIGTAATGAFGGLYSAPSAAWQATAGTAAISVTGSENACPNMLSITGITCTQASFSGNFGITHSTPFSSQGNTATGDKTAALPASTLAGFRFTINCSTFSC